MIYIKEGNKIIPRDIGQEERRKSSSSGANHQTEGASSDTTLLLGKEQEDKDRPSLVHKFKGKT